MNHKVNYSLVRSQLLENVRSTEKRDVVLWGHLGLGDQISLATSVEIWARLADRVFLPAKSHNYRNLQKIYGYISNVEVVKLGEFSSRDEEAVIRSLAHANCWRVIDGGRLLYNAIRLAYPEFGINRALAVAAGTNPSSLMSEKMRDYLALESRPMPAGLDYAFIDHHPGLEGRVIPEAVLLGIRDRGLAVMENPRGTPLYDLAITMANAIELHLVASAPLCLALVTGAGRGRRVAYVPGSSSLLGKDYGVAWEEVFPSSRIIDRATDKLRFFFNFKERSNLRKVLDEILVLLPTV